jgi:hypothetical protein
MSREQFDKGLALRREVTGDRKVDEGAPSRSPGRVFEDLGL